jgi:hypothetical protein
MRTIVRFIFISEEVILQTLNSLMAITERESAFWASIVIGVTPFVIAVELRIRILIDQMTLGAALLVIFTILLTFDFEAIVIVIEHIV